MYNVYMNNLKMNSFKVYESALNYKKILQINFPDSEIVIIKEN